MESPGVFLPPALALILQELAANALKFAALSSKDGTISLGWGFKGDGQSLVPVQLVRSRRTTAYSLLQRKILAAILFKMSCLKQRLRWISQEKAYLMPRPYGRILCGANELDC